MMKTLEQRLPIKLPKGSPKYFACEVRLPFVVYETFRVTLHFTTGRKDAYEMLISDHRQPEDDVPKT